MFGKLLFIGGLCFAQAPNVVLNDIMPLSVEQSTSQTYFIDGIGYTNLINIPNGNYSLITCPITKIHLNSNTYYVFTFYSNTNTVNMRLNVTYDDNTQAYLSFAATYYDSSLGLYRYTNRFTFTKDVISYRIGINGASAQSFRIYNAMGSIGSSIVSYVPFNSYYSYNKALELSYNKFVNNDSLVYYYSSTVFPGGMPNDYIEPTMDGDYLLLNKSDMYSSGMMLFKTPQNYTFSSIVSSCPLYSGNNVCYGVINLAQNKWVSLAPILSDDMYVYTFDSNVNTSALYIRFDISTYTNSSIKFGVKANVTDSYINQQYYNEGIEAGIDKVTNNASNYNLYYHTDYIRYGQEQYQVGYEAGIDDLDNGDLNKLLLTVAETPFIVFKEIWNFEVFGINLSTTILSLISLGVCIWVIKKVI